MTPQIKRPEREPEPSENSSKPSGRLKTPILPGVARQFALLGKLCQISGLQLHRFAAAAG